MIYGYVNVRTLLWIGAGVTFALSALLCLFLMFF